MTLALVTLVRAKSRLRGGLFLSMANISDMRAPYHGTDNTFHEDHLTAHDPLQQFRAWFVEASETSGIKEPNAMALATATREGIPSVRMMLLKGYDEDGFHFFTSRKSRKAAELESNPNCSLMFYWEPIKRSVRIEGTVERLPESVSSAYFQSRPKGSQLGAVVSYQQSAPIPGGRQALEKKYDELSDKYKEENSTVPKPDYWGGYCVKPHHYEFWQGQTNRLHDRIRFRKLKEGESFDETVMNRGKNGWIFERLLP